MHPHHILYTHTLYIYNKYVAQSQFTSHYSTASNSPPESRQKGRRWAGFFRMSGDFRKEARPTGRKRGRPGAQSGKKKAGASAPAEPLKRFQIASVGKPLPARLKITKPNPVNRPFPFPVERMSSSFGFGEFRQNFTEKSIKLHGSVS